MPPKNETPTSVRPVAIVALGDPSMGDDGVALRVMGRVRPLLGEIALTSQGTPKGRGRYEPMAAGGGQGMPVWLRNTMRSKAQKPARSPESSPASLRSIVDWIEGTTAHDLLAPVLESRKRVVLLDAVAHGASPGGVRHWHLEKRGKSGLSVIRFYKRPSEDPLDHLSFWLEDDLPVHGTDLIGIEPYRIEPGSELSPVLRSRLASITSQVGGLLLRILEEEGWQIGAGIVGGPMRRSGPRAA
jgi:Ni,Fe-hydrogenase maturation factor